MSISYNVTNLSKEFAGVHAVRDATFSVAQGTVHGVIGKNGAGKSVVMNMVAGALRPSRGEIAIGDSPVDVRHWTPRAASDHGVALIPQEPPDLPHLTVEDFLFLGDRSASKRGILRRTFIRRKVKEIDDCLALRVLPTDPMAQLPIEVQQLLAFGKAVFLEEARIVLLDEITASLSGARRAALLSQLRELREGRSFTLISHRIGEIMSSCDSVTVLRDGVSIETVAVDQTTPGQLASAIVGDADTHVHAGSEVRSSGRTVVEICRLSSPPTLGDVDLVVREHEVLGLAGVEGSGKDELLEALAGLRSFAGEVRLSGKPVRFGSPRAASRAGVAYLPKKREEFATIHGMSVLDNIVLPIAGRLAGPMGIVRESTLRSAGAPLVAQMQVKTPSLDADIDSLSGGNRQKVMLARLQLMRPKVYLLNEPTRGVDIATIPELLRAVRDRLTEHSAVIMTSESEEELIDTCDRILVFVRGQVVRELSRKEPDFTVSDLYRAAQGVGIA